MVTPVLKERGGGGGVKKISPIGEVMYISKGNIYIYYGNPPKVLRLILDYNKYHRGKNQWVQMKPPPLTTIEMKKIG